MFNMALENEFWTKKIVFSHIIEKFKCDFSDVKKIDYFGCVIFFSSVQNQRMAVICPWAFQPDLGNYLPPFKGRKLLHKQYLRVNVY